MNITFQRSGATAQRLNRTGSKSFPIHLRRRSLGFWSGLLLWLWIVNCGRAQTPVLFPLAQMTGTTNDTTITIRPVVNPIQFRGAVYWLPPAGIQLRTLNGSATTNLIPNDYNVTIATVPGSWKISVCDTNVTLNAALIGNLTTYTFTNPVPGVTKLIAGSNISLTPAGGQGQVTINAAGGAAPATNGFQLQAGNKLITLTTNTVTLVYTISGVSQTNGYPWGVLYDAAGAARSATNGYPWGTLYDAAGTARLVTNGYPWGVLYDASGSAAAVTNGYPWGALYDPLGSATAATNGWPWGVLYDAAGSATAATNGWPWSSLYDVVGSARAATNGWPWGVLYDPAGTAQAVTNGYPWGVLYDAAGTARAVTNGYPWGPLYDAAGSATAATNGWPWSSHYDAFGSASAATNGWPWGVLYDPSGSAQAATNGYPWGILYDAAGAASAATNGLSLASGLAAFRGTNTFAPTNVATATTRGLVKVDNSTITVSSDGTISATTGGGGSVTGVGLTMPTEFSVSNSPITTSGTLVVNRTADANFQGFGATNVGFIKVTNTLSLGGQATISALVLTNGFTNQALTASTLLEADANKKVTSVPNGAGVLTNDANGDFGYAPLLDASALKGSQYAATDGSTNLVSTQNGSSWTNLIGWSGPSTTNLTATFNGTLQSATITNGPTVFIHYAGANGSVSYRVTTNVTLVFDYQPKWLAGSNSVITNGVLSLTSYGGTNATQIEAAIKENL